VSGRQLLVIGGQFSIVSAEQLFHLLIDIIKTVNGCLAISQICLFVFIAIITDKNYWEVGLSVIYISSKNFSNMAFLFRGVAGIFADVNGP